MGWRQPPGAWPTSRIRPRPRPPARDAAWARAGASRGRAPHAAAPAAKADPRRAARRAAKAPRRAAARRAPRQRRSGATRPGRAGRRRRPARRPAAARRTAPPVRACTAAGCARAETALPRAAAGRRTALARGRARHACRVAIATRPRSRGRRARPSCGSGSHARQACRRAAQAPRIVRQRSQWGSRTCQPTRRRRRGRSRPALRTGSRLRRSACVGTTIVVPENSCSRRLGVEAFYRRLLLAKTLALPALPRTPCSELSGSKAIIRRP